MNKSFLLSSLILSVSLSGLSSQVHSFEYRQSALVASGIENQAKQDLKAKLSQLKFFSAQFQQEIKMESGEILQESQGKVALQRPNSLYWETYEPDALYIISEGDDVWFYNPWIEEVSIYNVSTASAQTPFLLLINSNDALWDQYQVVEHKSADTTTTAFVIKSLDTNSQVNKLTLTFKTTQKGDVLSSFSILDATGQTSLITLSEFNNTTPPDASLFQFKLPEGVDIKDHRSQ